MSGTGIEVVLTLPKCFDGVRRAAQVIVLQNIARVCSVGCTGTRDIFGGRIELTEVSGTGILRWYRIHQCVGYRYRSRTERIEVSGTGIELVPNHTEVLGNRSKPCQR